MRAWLESLWDALRGSFWFLPGIMALAATALAVLTLHADETWPQQWIAARGLLWTGDPQGGRQVLSALVGALATVAGVVFSITVVALSIASSQFGPLLLRNFTRDPGNQLVLGAFIAAFVYCVLVLGVVRGGDDPFLPQLSITIGVALAVISLAVLIYFVHHVARSINAEQLVANVGTELTRGIARIFPEELGEEPQPEAAPTGIPSFAESVRHVVPAPRTGYLQAIDAERLMKAATQYDLVLQLLNRPGDFVIRGGELARLSRAPDDAAVVRHVQRACIIGPRRTPTQDIEYLAHEIVQIAVRALSPGTNDPFTAIVCVDWLGAALSELANRKIPSPSRLDAHGRVRVIAPTTSFPDLADIAFNQIRQYGKNSVAVSLRLLEAVLNVAEHVRRPADRQALREHAQRIHEDAQRTQTNDRDRRKLRDVFEKVVGTLEGERPPATARSASGSEESEKS